MAPHEVPNGTSSMNATNGHSDSSILSLTSQSPQLPKYTWLNDDHPPYVPQTCSGVTAATLSLFSLKGKTALITGGNGGIGGGMTRGLAEAGADIIIFQIPGEVSKFAAQLRASTDRKVYVYDCDMGDSKAIRTAVQKVLDDGLVIDILCNCAGISSGSMPVLGESDEHKDAIIQINFNAVWIMCQAVGRHMATRGQGGKIINIASLAAHKAMTKFSVYGPMKAAIAQVTNSYANELGPYNIQVNCLLPGWIQTSLAQRFVDDEEFNRTVIGGIPLKRWGQPDDFKGITVFLASRASEYINGARIFIDGGVHSM